MGKIKTILCGCGCGENAPTLYIRGLNKGRTKYISEHRPGARVNGKKKCTRCKQWRDLENFYALVTQNRISARCKECSRIISNEFGYKKYGGKRGYWLHKRYGITLNQFEEILNRNKGICPLCNKRPGVAVDHCHQTGKVRGILCSGCNRALGTFGDTFIDIQRVLSYFSS